MASRNHNEKEILLSTLPLWSIYLLKKRLDFMSSTDFIFKVIHEPEYIGDNDIKKNK